MTPGMYLRQKRKIEGMSLRTLGDMLNLSHVYLGDIERGDYNV